MSRTYRRDAVRLDCNCGAPIGWHLRWFWEFGTQPIEEAQREEQRARSRGVVPDRVCNCWTNRHYDYYSKRNFKRDRKDWQKSSSDFKKVMQRRRRAKERNAMVHEDYDNIPIFHNENDWNWN